MSHSHSMGPRRTLTDRSPGKLKFRIVEMHEQKILPVVGASAESSLHRELCELESFFGMDDQQMTQSVHEMFRTILPTKEELTRPNTSAALGTAPTFLPAELMMQVSTLVNESRLGDLSPLARPPGEMRPEPAQEAFLPSAPFDLPCSSQSTQMTRSGSSWHRATAARSFSQNIAEEALTTIISIGSQSPDTKAAKQRIHQPVTSQELVAAAEPRPVAVPPIFPRGSDRPRESHYAYFMRKIPGERPDRRRVMWGRAACTRKACNFNEIIGSG